MARAGGCPSRERPAACAPGPVLRRRSCARAAGTGPPTPRRARAGSGRAAVRRGGPRRFRGGISRWDVSA